MIMKKKEVKNLKRECVGMLETTECYLDIALEILEVEKAAIVEEIDTIRATRMGIDLDEKQPLDKVEISSQISDRLVNAIITKLQEEEKSDALNYLIELNKNVHKNLISYADLGMIITDPRIKNGKVINMENGMAFRVDEHRASIKFYEGDDEIGSVFFHPNNQEVELTKFIDEKRSTVFRTTVIDYITDPAIRKNIMEIKRYLSLELFETLEEE